MITLRELWWDNCFSYGRNNHLVLNRAVVTQILGYNGYGKSSIPLIIEEALFNKNSKGIKKADIPNTTAQDGYYIHLLWDKDGDSYAITVDRKTGIKIKLEKNGEDISSHTATNTYKTVQEILGVDFKTFSQLVYQSNNASLQFLTATDTNRKKFLIDLLHLEEYVNLFEVFKELARDLNSKKIGISAKVATIEKWLNDNKLSDTTILPMLDLEINTDEDEKKLSKITKEIDSISDQNKKILENNQFKTLLAKIDLAEVQNSEIKGLESYDALQQELGGLRGVKAESVRLLTKLSKLESTCPTCEQPIDEDFKTGLIDTATQDINAAETSDARITREIEEIKQQNRLFERRRKLQQDWESLYRSIEPKLPSDLLDEEQLRARMGRIQKRLRDARDSLATTARENESRTRRNTRIQVIEEQTEAFSAELQENLEILEEQQELLSNLEVLKKAFSTNGLLAYKIENLVKDLEDLTNMYLAELSDGKFTLEFIVNNDKLNVQITKNGRIVDILSLSTGQLARVNAATLLAIRRLMSSISKSRLNLLFFDDVIGVLDDAGREKLIEVLLQEESLNTYVISQAWSHPLLEKIEVVMEDEMSRLEK